MRCPARRSRDCLGITTLDIATLFFGMIAAMVGLSALMVVLTAGANSPSLPLTPKPSPSVTQLGQSFLGLIDATREAPLTGMKNPPERKKVAYLLPFELVSVHLLVVLIGAAYLARAKRSP